MRRIRRFDSENTVKKEAVITKAGVFNYGSHTLDRKDLASAGVCKVLKDKELMRSLPDKLKTIFITRGHNGDVIIQDGGAHTEGGGEIIGCTGSNAVYDEEKNQLTVDIRILADALEELKSTGELGLSIGAKGSNIWSPGVDPEYGAYDAKQVIESISHIAAVTNPRVEGCKINDSDSDEINICTTFFINDESESEEMTNELESANEENQTQAAAEEAKEFAAPSPTSPEITPVQAQPETEEKLRHAKSGINMETIERLVEKVKAQEQVIEKLLQKDQEEQQKIDFENTQRRLKKLVESVQPIIGQIPEEESKDLERINKYLVQKLSLHETTNIDAVEGYVKGYNEALNKTKNRQDFFIAKNNQSNDNSLLEKLASL